MFAYTLTLCSHNIVPSLICIDTYIYSTCIQSLFMYYNALVMEVTFAVNRVRLSEARKCQ